MHIGIIGCGQLARMLALSGLPMGLTFSFLGEGNDSAACVQGLGNVVHRDQYMDSASLYQAMGRPQLITVEKENVDTVLLKQLQGFCPVYPEPEIIHICQHRGREKSFLNDLGVDTARFELIKDIGQLPQAISRLGLPVIIKTCEQGYDGQNQWSLNDPRQYSDFINSGITLPESVVEARVSFLREISLLIVRSIHGNIAVYPPIENHHDNGILLTSLAPVDDLSAEFGTQIDRIVARVMAGWNYVGVLTIECFVTGNRILVNEMAPRVHNSGHWTQQGAMTSQFENHLRAITGTGLGSTRARGYTAMVNLLGRNAPGSLISQANAHLHLYNKAIRPRRKIGHINLLDDNKLSLKRQLDTAVSAIYSESTPMIKTISEPVVDMF